MDKAAVLAALNELAVPPASLVIMGGSALAVYGIRSAEDIDLLVSPETYNKLSATPGWEREDSHGVHRLVSKNGLFDVWQWWYDERSAVRILYEEVLRHAVNIPEGYMVPSLDYLLKLKRMGLRDKDKADVQLLKNYMKKPRQ